MFEMILNPKKGERRPWELLFVGFFYASLAILITHWVFSGDPVLSKYSGILVVTFAVILSMPYVYYTIKLEEYKDTHIKGKFRLLEEHGKALATFLFLFVGFILAFSFWYIMLGSPDNLRAQIETYCSINYAEVFTECINEHGITTGGVTGFSTSFAYFEAIFTNNLYVLIFSLIFSIVFGAGGIFILAWNASVISAAMVIYSKSEIMNLPISLFRYMIHGMPEIAAYFVGTLAGGIIGLSIIRKEYKTDKFWSIINDSLLLIIIAIIILLVAALIEVYVTPLFF